MGAGLEPTGRAVGVELVAVERVAVAPSVAGAEDGWGEPGGVEADPAPAPDVEPRIPSMGAPSSPSRGKRSGVTAPRDAGLTGPLPPPADPPPPPPRGAGWER